LRILHLFAAALLTVLAWAAIGGPAGQPEPGSVTHLLDSRVPEHPGSAWEAAPVTAAVSTASIWKHAQVHSQLSATILRTLPIGITAPVPESASRSHAPPYLTSHVLLI
jgi:hypothetical protein